MLLEDRGRRPVVPDSAYVAPSVVLCGAVVLAERGTVLHGAVLTAENGEVRLGRNSVVMENALVRGRADRPALISDAVLVGPHAHVNGATVEDEVFIATGASLFPGSVAGLGLGSPTGRTIAGLDLTDELELSNPARRRGGTGHRSIDGDQPCSHHDDHLLSLVVKAHSPLASHQLLYGDRPERVDLQRPPCGTSEVLRGLDLGRQRAYSPEQVGHHQAFVVPAHYLGGPERRDVAVEEAVWQQDHVRCEAIATDVTALPRPVGVHRSQSSGGWTATHGTARVVPSMGADQVDRFIAG